MFKRLIIFFLIILNTSSTFAFECKKKDCLIVPWPKGCDEFCGTEALKNADILSLINIFKFDSNLSDKIIRVRDDSRFTNTPLFKKLEYGLSYRELNKIYNSIRALSPQDQEEIVKRGLIFTLDLATSFMVNPNGKEITFTLRENILMNDERTFNALVLKEVLDKNRYVLGGYQRSEIIDDLTIKIFLSDFSNEFLQKLSEIMIIRDTNGKPRYLIGTNNSSGRSSLENR